MAYSTCEKCGNRTNRGRKLCSVCSPADKTRELVQIESVDDFGGRIFATLSEVAVLFGCERDVIRSMATNGQVPVNRIGRRDMTPVWWLRGVACGAIDIPAPTGQVLLPHQAWIRIKHGALKAQVLSAYGEVCACCSRADDLQLDRIDGNGKAVHAETGRGAQLYRWLITQDFPDGWQVLCGPCNNSKGTGPCCLLDHSLRSLLESPDVILAG